MRKEFAFYPLSIAGKEKGQQIAEAFDELLTKIEALCPKGRELALVTTKLEEASFFAKKAMASASENQEP
jgi:hypothetical protein